MIARAGPAPGTVHGVGSRSGAGSLPAVGGTRSIPSRNASCGDAGRELFAYGQDSKLVRIVEGQGGPKVAWSAPVAAIAGIDACEGATVTTIEGLAPDGKLHPMQEAFREHHGLQCGFCTPGMIMSAVDMVNRKGKDLDERTIREELEGNICRCTGYHNIVKAILAAAGAMKGARKAA